jgi:putative transposase
VNPRHQIRYTYFLTAATHDRFPYFRRREIAQVALDRILRYDGERFELHAAVIMPDHIHALFTPANDQLVERCVQCIKGGISHSLRDFKKGAELWQRVIHTRRVRDDEEFAAFVKYIGENPEKARLGDWPFVYIGATSRR